MTRALVIVILVLINEFIKNDNKKSQKLNSIYHIKQKKSHSYCSQVYSLQLIPEIKMPNNTSVLWLLSNGIRASFMW